LSSTQNTKHTHYIVGLRRSPIAALAAAATTAVEVNSFRTGAALASEQASRGPAP